MRKFRWAPLAAAVALSLLLTGCSLPMGGFADYDVSGYFQALLDSSYLGNNTEYVERAGTTEEKAEENNNTTVQNAAVNFCNTYGISPNDDQLAQLEEVMRQALLQANYTVKDEQKVEQGYYLEVEILPIVNFSGLEDQIDSLREEAQEEASKANSQTSSRYESGSGYDDGSDTGDGGYGYEDTDDSYSDYGYDDSYDSYDSDNGSDYGEEESSQSSSSQDREENQTVNANELFVDKVVEYCQEQLSNIRFGDEAITISLDIRQTEDGELQLDTNQLDTIDRTVLQFQS